jgi:hypothetical protein
MRRFPPYALPAISTKRTRWTWRTTVIEHCPIFPGRSPFTPVSLTIASVFLAGQFRPTGGIIGTLSDLTLGRRIAQASASNLLHTIATYVKVASARNEAARAGKRPYDMPSVAMELMQQRSGQGGRVATSLRNDAVQFDKTFSNAQFLK